MQNAPDLGAFAKEIADDRDVSRSSTSRPLDQARARLDKSVQLLNWALDLRELLWCGLDLDEMRDQVTDLKRDLASHKRRPI